MWLKTPTGSLASVKQSGIEEGACHSRAPVTLGGRSCQGHISAREETVSMPAAAGDPPCWRKEFMRSRAVRCTRPGSESPAACSQAVSCVNASDVPSALWEGYVLAYRTECRLGIERNSRRPTVGVSMSCCLLGWTSLKWTPSLACHPTHPQASRLAE